MTFNRAVLRFLALISIAACLSQALLAAKVKAKTEGPAYKGAIVMNASTGEVLFEENADCSSPPASMTKLMTYAVLHDMLQEGSIHLDSQVSITAADRAMGGTQVFLEEKEVFPVEELIYAMMIQSANDAAYALARTCSGSIPAFVAKMNEKAGELGMTHTTFRTPHGLPSKSRRISEGDVTSPRDFAILSRHLVQKTDILKYTSVRRRPFGPPVRAEIFMMDNHNKLVDRVAGVDGLKTGYTESAGFCLSATALRNGKRLIVVVMDSATAKVRDNRVIELLEEGFAKIPPGSPDFVGGSAPKPIITSNSPVKRSPVPAASAPPAAASDSGPVIHLNIPTKRKNGK